MPDRFDKILAELRSDRAESRRESAAQGARIDAALEKTDENLRFLGELNRRNEIVLREVVRSSQAMRAEIRASIAETAATNRAMRKEIEANTETTKAHTRAIFAVIDRLEGGGGGPAPAT